MRLAAVSHVRDFHVKHVIAGKHTVGGLDVPRVRQSTVDGQNTSQALVVVAGEDVGLSNGDVNRFNVEDHALDVVGLRQFVVVVPRLADGGVVKGGLHVQTIDTREELVARDNGGSGFFCIDVGSGIGVNSVLDEGVFLQGDVVETNALEAVIDAVAAVIVRLEIKVDINHGALKRHALRSPLAGVRRRAVLNVQVGQVNARGLDEFIGIEEHVVVATAVGVGRIADEGQLRLVNGFGGVDDAVAVVVVLTGAVFVVVVPLSEDQTGVVGAVFVVVNRHRCVITGINVTALVNGVESISIVLEVERNEIAAHARQVDVGDGERFVGPGIVVAEGAGITGMAEPVGVVVEDLRRTRVFVVDGALWLLVFLVAVAFTAALEGFLTDR